jgi:hypothetical protein
VDERAVGKAYKKAIQLQPIVRSEIHAPNGGAMVIGSLFGNRFSCTMADGTLGSVEVSPESLKATQQIIQNLLDALPWRSPRFGRVAPSP